MSDEQEFSASNTAPPTPHDSTPKSPEQLARELAERMLAEELMSRTFNPSHVDDWIRQIQWEADYVLKKADRLDRNYLAWRRHLKGK